MAIVLSKKRSLSLHVKWQSTMRMASYDASAAASPTGANLKGAT
jgi:hypothetical protein